ncbi:hypothetical protein ACFL6M_02745 [Candidatus Eisenbacteria bacterium]|uniref:EamA domain-containing protein n=1 Tax=Eiseniibacteriota bacterium TaxID=2212470 RepID=A0ABV6YJJ6_UNCEI
MANLTATRETGWFTIVSALILLTGISIVCLNLLVNLAVKNSLATLGLVSPTPLFSALVFGRGGPACTKLTSSSNPWRI